jgi:hypothetical protein
VIKLATPGDLPELLEMFRECFDAQPDPIADYDPVAAERLTLQFLSEPDKAVILAPGVGCIYAFASGVFYNPSVYQAYELIWWVRPGKQRNADALRLFLCYEEWAKKVGCSSVQAGEVHGWNSLEKLYRKRGYTKTETSYRKRIHGN